MVALLTSVRNSPCFGGLRRTKTCHRQLFARPSMLFGYFLHDAKSDNPFPFREFRGFANLDSAHRSHSFTPQQLKPFYRSFEVLQTSNQRTQTTNSCNPIKSFFRFAAVSLPGRHTLCAFRRRFAAFLSACGGVMLLPQQALQLRKKIKIYILSI